MGTVHEQIAPSLSAIGIELVNCPDFSIRHTGYEEEGKSLEKNIRNLKLLAKELVARPEDPYVLLALAQAFLFCGQTEHANKWLNVLWGLREKVNGAGSDDIFWMAAVMLADRALEQGDSNGSDEWLKRAIELRPADWLAYFRRGELRLAEGDWESAAELLKKADEIGVGPTLLPLDLDTLCGKLKTYLFEIERQSMAASPGVS